MTNSDMTQGTANFTISLPTGSVAKGLFDFPAAFYQPHKKGTRYTGKNCMPSFLIYIFLRNDIAVLYIFSIDFSKICHGLMLSRA